MTGKAGSVLGKALAALLVLAVVLTSAVAIIGQMPRASAFSGIDVNLQRPEFAGPDQNVEMTLTIGGGPAADFGGNFTYTATVKATNTTGSSVTPSSGTNAKGVFKLNVTMPTEAPQTVTISINATSVQGTGGPSRFLVKEFTIAAVVPIELKATVFNNGQVDALNVTAKFFADGVLLNTQLFNVSAFGSKVLTYNWTFLKIASGKHVVSITVDEPSKVVEFSDGNNAISRTIFVGKQGNPAGAVLTVAVVILAVLVALMYLQKPIKRKKSPGVR